MQNLTQHSLRWMGRAGTSAKTIRSLTTNGDPQHVSMMPEICSRGWMTAR
jgi:hypothetical protein